MTITPELFAIALYIAILFAIGFFSYRKNQTATDFIIGGRSLNYWVTAMAAHASDMGSWLTFGIDPDNISAASRKFRRESPLLIRC